MKAIATAREYSNKRIKVMREALVGEIASDSFSIVLGGSYARREASDESDLDFYVIATPAGVPRAKRSLPRIREVLASVIKAPTKNGLFGTVHHSREMLKNIGGTKDTNEKFTIRTLFLTEGEWLSNEKLFAATRQSLTARYLQPYLKQSQLARFFLNDLMRCYRTICVDFENKTFEKEKPWGPRNIKLRFSRKLLYFSGAIVAAEVADLPADGKVERMLDLLGRR